jgi:hypothetical protein
MLLPQEASEDGAVLGKGQPHPTALLYEPTAGFGTLETSLFALFY